MRKPKNVIVHKKKKKKKKFNTANKLKSPRILKQKFQKLVTLVDES